MFGLAMYTRDQGGASAFQVGIYLVGDGPGPAAVRFLACVIGRWEPLACGSIWSGGMRDGT